MPSPQSKELKSCIYFLYELRFSESEFCRAFSYTMLIYHLWANPPNFAHVGFTFWSSAMSLFTWYSASIVTKCSFTTYELPIPSYESFAYVSWAHENERLPQWVKRKHVQEPCRNSMKITSRATLARVSDYLSGLKSEACEGYLKDIKNPLLLESCRHNLFKALLEYLWASLAFLVIITFWQY